MIKQLTVKLPNQPGTLKGLVKTLAGAGVDMKALGVSDRGTDHGEASMIVSDVDKATAALAGYELQVQEVIAVEMDDRVGGLAAILELFEANDVNVAQLYAFVSRHKTKALAVIRVDGDPARAAKALSEGGFAVASRIDGPDAPPEGPKPLDEHLGLDFIW